MTKKRASLNQNAHAKSKSSSQKNDEFPATINTDGITLSSKLLTFFIVSAILAVSWHAAKIQLTPLYGSSAASAYFVESLTATLALSSFIPTNALLGVYALPGLSGWLIAIPILLQNLGTTLARRINPLWGAAWSYVFALGPATILLQSVTKYALFPNRKSSVEERYKQTKHVIAALLPSLFVTYSEKQCASVFNLLAKLSLLPSHIHVILGVAAMSLYVLYPGLLVKTSSSRSRNMLSIIIPVTTTVLILMLSLTQPPLRSLSLPYEHPTAPIRILSSTQSVTGRIVVGENLDHSFRYLRADHSILGGVWVGDKVVQIGTDGKMLRAGDVEGNGSFRTDIHGTKLGDSIYSAFVLQEGARLHRGGKEQSALIIGLGAGISAQALISHNLSTTIIEIDPAVYTAARNFFGLEEPTSVFLEDARSWVNRRARRLLSPTSDPAEQDEKYDIIIHDCFSGGGVPSHLFTVEFWQDLKSILDSEGIVAVNFAGHLVSQSSRAILLTLQMVFGQCRVFHDHPLDSNSDILTQFINMVFFCTPSSRMLEFRPALHSDYLDSYLREYILKVFDKREIDPELIGGHTETLSEDEKATWMITDKRNPLDLLQRTGALEHWHVMRSVLPDVFWETY